METFWCGVCEREIENEATFSHAPISKWKTRRRDLTRMKVCPVCGSDFRARRSDTLYCSSLCRQKAYRIGRKAVRRRMKNDRIMRRCRAPGCSHSLAGRTNRAKYCSPACRVRVAYHRDKKEARFHRGVRA